MGFINGIKIIRSQLNVHFKQGWAANVLKLAREWRAPKARESSDGGAEGVRSIEISIKTII
jgi:hypothetical protein